MTRFVHCFSPTKCIFRKRQQQRAYKCEKRHAFSGRKARGGGRLSKQCIKRASPSMGVTFIKRHVLHAVTDGSSRFALLLRKSAVQRITMSLCRARGFENLAPIEGEAAQFKTLGWFYKLPPFNFPCKSPWRWPDGWQAPAPLQSAHVPVHSLHSRPHRPRRRP